jgi:acetyl esterase/lipase
VSGAQQAEQAALAAQAHAYADQWRHRVLGAIFNLLPRLPVAASSALVRRSRAEIPDETVRQRCNVVPSSEAGVPVVWLNRERSANGVIVYIHGGAFVAGPAQLEWHWLSSLSNRNAMAAVGILYRKPPDHPFPAALDDTVACIRSMCTRRELRARHWVLAGGSAGGGLAVSTMRALLDLHLMSPAGLLLMAPWVDLALKGAGVAEAEAVDPLLSRRWLGWAAASYAGQVPLADPRLSPLHAVLQGFPRTRIDIGTRDIFLPDCRRLRDRLLAANVLVDHVEQSGGVHSYPFNTDRPEAEVALVAQARWVAERLRDWR